MSIRDHDVNRRRHIDEQNERHDVDVDSNFNARVMLQAIDDDVNARATGSNNKHEWLEQEWLE